MPGKPRRRRLLPLSDEKISHSEAHAYTVAASHRHRIVHCQFIGEDLLARIKDAGLCADIQPPFTASDYPIVDARVGVERSDWSYVWRTMAEAGIPLGGGSDSPVETMNPIWGIDCAVNRTDLTYLPAEGLACFAVPDGSAGNIALYTRQRLHRLSNTARDRSQRGCWQILSCFRRIFLRWRQGGSGIFRYWRRM